MILRSPLKDQPRLTIYSFAIYGHLNSTSAWVYQWWWLLGPNTTLIQRNGSFYTNCYKFTKSRLSESLLSVNCNVNSARRQHKLIKTRIANREAMQYAAFADSRHIAPGGGARAVLQCKCRLWRTGLNIYIRTGTAKRIWDGGHKPETARGQSKVAVIEGQYHRSLWL